MAQKKRRYCRTCGAEALDQAKFCLSCGASLNTTAPYPVPGLPSSPVTGASSSPAPVMTPSVGGSVKMGFGIAAGMLLFMLVVGAIVLVGIGFATSTLTWPFAEPAGQRFEGLGSSESVAISLSGRYRVEWSAETTSPASCPLNASLRSPGNTSFAAVLVSANIPNASPPVGNSSILELAEGSYILGVSSSCRWSFRLVPID